MPWNTNRPWWNDFSFHQGRVNDAFIAVPPWFTVGKQWCKAFRIPSSERHLLLSVLITSGDLQLCFEKARFVTYVNIELMISKIPHSFEQHWNTSVHWAHVFEDSTLLCTLLDTIISMTTNVCHTSWSTWVKEKVFWWKLLSLTTPSAVHLHTGDTTRLSASPALCAFLSIRYLRFNGLKYHIQFFSSYCTHSSNTRQNREIRHASFL